MIGHDDERMQLVSLKLVLPVLQGLDHQFSDFLAPQMYRTAGATIQEPAHRHECSSRQRQSLGSEHPMRRKTPVQPKRYKQRLRYRVPVRESPFIVPHFRVVPVRVRISQKIAQ